MRSRGYTRAVRLLLALCLVASPAQDLDAQTSTALSAELGEVNFPTSGSPAAQAHFLRGLALLHSFEYEDAAEAFRLAQRVDSSFAMAYWGEAMTYNHPIWMEQDGPAARTVLARLAPTAEMRQLKAPTERERDYLAALEILYGEGPKEARDTAYARAMERLSAKHPDDPEAAAFYALALLGTAHHGRDIPTYMRAAAVVEEVFRDNPRHPGAMHYLIHSYDDPVHAPLGLRAARAYAKIAPAAAHAQHMRSHIFVAMGMWDDVVAANEAAVAAVNRNRAAKGQPPEACGHYPRWLHYGYLQQGRYGEARRILEGCYAEALALGTPRAVFDFVAMRSRHILDTEDWQADAIGMRIDLEDNPSLRHVHDFATAFASLRRGDAAAARPVLERMLEARRVFEAKPASHGGSASRLEALHASRLEALQILEEELHALMFVAEGEAEEAIALLRTTAEREEKLPVEFGPPAIDKPSHELLGEVLLAMNRPIEARGAFEAALKRTPGRVTSLWGLARAAERGGDSARAEQVRATLRAIRHRADPGLDDLP